jgi:hypothetical protein
MCPPGVPTRTGRLPEERADGATERPEPAAADPAILELQRSAGNAAVSRLLQRESLTMRGPADLRLGSLTAGIGADYSAAMDAVYAWFDQAAEQNEGSFVQSLPELVYMAGQLAFTKGDGSAAKVCEEVKPNELELGIRGRSKTLGLRLLEHRSMSDLAGVQSEAMAVLGNLGRIPTSVKFGGGDDKLEISITGTVTGSVAAGDTKLEAEASPAGASVSATDSAGGKVEGHVTPEGAGVSVSGEGTKVGLDYTGKGFKAEVKAGDLVTVRGSVGREDDGSVGWKAEITIGTLGKIVSPGDIAKVMVGAQETFGRSAGELVRGINDPEKLKEHGGALMDAVSEVAEKAQKSAAQAKAGWSLGLEAKGTDQGGFSAAVTLTWVF